jgi:RNA-directed DNA polymerase
MTMETTETFVSDPSIGATTDSTLTWHQINWRQAERTVRRLQTRIAQATQAGKWGKVKALQHLLTHSFSGKALAVRRVTENTGKRTPGVDGETWKTPEQKMTAIRTLRQRGYRPRPLRRVYIPKSNGGQRPLSIPTMQDRAMQALYPAFA